MKEFFSFNFFLCPLIVAILLVIIMYRKVPYAPIDTCILFSCILSGKIRTFLLIWYQIFLWNSSFWNHFMQATSTCATFVIFEKFIYLSLNIDFNSCSMADMLCIEGVCINHIWTGSRFDTNIKMDFDTNIKMVWQLHMHAAHAAMFTNTATYIRWLEADLWLDGLSNWHPGQGGGVWGQCTEWPQC